LNILVKNKKKYKSDYIFVNHETVTLDKYDIVINATTLGFDNRKKMSPLSKSKISKLKSKCFIFDIIYNPSKTEFLKRCKRNKLKTLNGLDMNLRQAAIAFKYTIKAFKTYKAKKIMKIMAK